MDLIYMDNAATTRTDPEVLDTMLPYFSEGYGNPSSIHYFGQHTRRAVDKARDEVAQFINASPGEIIFTGGGSEADNLAVMGSIYKNAKRGKHIITSAVEHHAVLDTCKAAEKRGFKVTFLPVDEYGMVDLDELKTAITDDTILISVMYANNEVGTIQPIKDIATIAREKEILFHTDAVQAVGQIPIDVKDLGIDLLTMSAHKVYGPKGVGALYVRKSVKLTPHIYGGGQEAKRRAGTENVPGIVGFAKALKISGEKMEQNISELTRLRDRLIKGITVSIEEVKLNGHPVKRLPGNVNISFKYIEGEAILLLLDQNGIAASSGSACTSGSLDPSHVLLAMGLPHELAHGSIRFSLGKYNNDQEIDRVLDVLPNIVDRLREMSPLVKGNFNGDE